ncbi:MAG: hypothetical protein ACPH5G_12910 [Pseudooceanicola atlanticus]
MTEKTPERAALEARAEALKLTFAPNIGDAKLAERVTEAETKASSGSDKSAGPTTPSQAPTPAKPTQAKVPPADPVARLTVIGPKRGRRRAGRHFSAEPVELDPAELTDAELQAIQSDPLLIVSPT